MPKIARSAKSGQFVTKGTAKRRPATTVVETVGGDVDARIVKAAMAWYRKWNRECGNRPSTASGHALGEVALYRACERKHRTANH